LLPDRPRQQNSESVRQIHWPGGDGRMGERPVAHRDTAMAWDVVARTKYLGEFDAHVARLREGGDNLLRPEAEALADLIAGAHVVQLQCSHGLDALGLLNAGARSVVGVDISAEMVAQATAKAEALGYESASFICADVLDPPSRLHETADLVYTGRGSLPWILDLSAWAAAVTRILKPGGSLFLYEGHPLASLWDRTAPSPKLRPGAGYFATEPKEDPGFPADVVQREVGEGRPPMLERHWHPGEVLAALLDVGLEVRHLREYPDLFWDQFPQWPDQVVRSLPNSYSILARRPESGHRGSV